MKNNVTILFDCCQKPLSFQSKEFETKNEIWRAISIIETLL